MSAAKRFRITSQQRGLIGYFEGGNELEALDAMARSEGCESYISACRAVGILCGDWTTVRQHFKSGVDLLVEEAPLMAKAVSP